jgi:hypothetical protein
MASLVAVTRPTPAFFFYASNSSRMLHSSTSQVAGILFPCSRKLSWKRASISSFSHRREARTTLASAAIERRDSSYSPPWFSVAPMMDWTDNHYRTLARLISRRAWLYTEMIVADAINHQQENLVSESSTNVWVVVGSKL